MAHKLYDLVVSTGVYTNKAGDQKKKYLNIGSVFGGEGDSMFLVLQRHINLAGLPFKDGSDSVLVSCFEPRDDRGGKAQTPRGGGDGVTFSAPNDIPF
jgi:hypothetical protein